MIAPLLGAFASLGGAALGAGAQANAAKYNYVVDMMNYYLRERERRDRIRAMERERSDSHLGTTDSMGNRTHFVEGKGWVQELSPVAQAMMNAQNSEQMRVLSEDLPAARQQRQTNARRQKEEEYTATGLRDEFESTRKELPENLERLLLNAATHGQSKAFDEAQSNFLRNALRTGASNTGTVLSKMARERADAFAKAGIDARLQARGLVQEEYDNKRKNVSNLYNMFATRAGAMPNVSYKPENIEGDQSAHLRTLLKGKFGLADELGKAYGQKGGELSFVEPQYAAANGLTAAGNQLASAFGKMNARNQWMEDREDYENYYGGNSNDGDF